jgi:type II secretory pathway component PulF
LGDYYDHKQRLSTEWQKLLRYPFILVLSLGILFYILATFLLPELQAFIAPEKQGFSYHSLKWGMDHMQYICIAGVLLAGILYIKRSFIFRIPIIKRFAMLQFWKNMVFCLKADLMFIDALRLCSSTVPAPIQPFLKHIKEHIESGETITVAFKNSHLAPAALLSMLSMGEQTGKMADMLHHYCTFDDHALLHTLNRFMSWTPTFLLLIIGLVIMWILTATILPLYDNLSNITH